MMKFLKEINYNAEKEDLNLKKQALISDFFSKKQVVSRRKYCCILMISVPLDHKYELLC